MLGTSEADVVWEIDEWTRLGEYRLRYYGDSKSVGGISQPLRVSGTFTVG